MSFSRVDSLSKDRRQLLDQADAFILRRYPVLRYAVIVQDDKLLWTGCYRKAAANLSDPVPIAPIKSVTKSIIALLTGIAIDQGLLKGTDQTLGELLPGRADDLSANPQAAALTLHHLLSMTTGFLWRGGRAGMEPLARRMMDEQDWLRFILALPVVARDIGSFQYNSAVSHLLSVVIEETSGLTSAEFARQNLFAPLGIDEFEWESAPDGSSIGGWGLNLSALSMARIGQLCIDRGRHGDEPVVSSEWIDKIWTPVCDVTTQHGMNQPRDFEKAQYGYQWWIRGNAEIQLFCAEGAGGQMIVCIPERQAVIVTSCEYTRRGVSLWPLFERYWIPLLTQSCT